jgi:glycosyltransferase involved in cell wall biosynthesis
VTAARGPSPAPVRVLLCEGNTDGTIGGSYFSLLYLVEGFKGSGYQPAVVFHREHALLARYSECAEVHVMERRRPVRLLTLDSRFRQRHPALSAPVRLLQRGVNFLGFAATVVQYARFLVNQRIALLHLNNSVTRAHDWMLAALLTRTPCVVHERGINDQFPSLARLLAPRLSAVICISDAVRCNLLEHRVSRSNLHVIVNGLDPERVKPERSREIVLRSLGIADHQQIVGMVGNIREWKGQEVLVRALPAILARVPDVVCLFVGAATEADQPYAKRLRSIVADLSLGDHVVFAGYSANVADFLNVVNVAVHASVLPEPFGRVLLEAMAMEKPVVGSRSGAVPEIVDHGVTGYTFAPGDVDALASCVIDLLERPSAARAFGAAGHARLLERFSITANVSRTLRLYDEILSTPEIRR